VDVSVGSTVVPGDPKAFADPTPRAHSIPDGPADPSAHDAARRDPSGRALTLRPVALERFFSPRRVAVVGASDTPGRPTTAMWRKLVDWAATHGADVLAVNPHRTEVDGRRCVPTLAATGLEPGSLDVVAVLTGDVEDAVDQALSAAAAFVVIFAAGFAEAGPEGRRREAALRARLVGSTTRVLGPNTNLNAFETFEDLPGPALALVTQSGHQGRPVFQAQRLGVAVSHWAPTGNEADLEAADFLAWFSERPEVGAVAAYLEGVNDGRTLQLALDRCVATDTPVVAVKVGRSAAGRSMAASHTGHLTGGDRVVDGVFAQYGVTRVDGLDELQETATLLARWDAPTAPGVCIYGISGGSGAHLADLCGAAGLDLPTLADDTVATLRRHIPGYLRVDNPVDCGGGPAMDERGRAILEALVADPSVGVVVCPLTGALPALTEPLARDLVAVARSSPRPVCVIWGSPVVDDPALVDVLFPSGIPVFRSFPGCVAALSAWFRWHALRGRWRSPFDTAPRRLSPAGRRAGQALAAATAAGRNDIGDVSSGGSGTGGGSGGRPALTSLPEHEAKAVLAAAGIPVTRDVLCTSAAAAGRAAADLGGPAVLKIVSPDIAHRSDLGLVRTGVVGATAAQRVSGELAARAAEQAPTARIDGVLVCEQIDDAVEVHLGMVHDEVFGPAVTVGLGGIWVEVLDDLAVRVPPFDRAEAHRMLADTRAAAVLAGVRGRRPAATGALVDLLVRFGRLALEVGDAIAELDCNPVLVTADRAVVADALLVPRLADTGAGTPPAPGAAPATPTPGSAPATAPPAATPPTRSRSSR
jgi:acetate---CoA ligase (ADP-forming)